MPKGKGSSKTGALCLAIIIIATQRLILQKEQI